MASIVPFRKQIAAVANGRSDAHDRPTRVLVPSAGQGEQPRGPDETGRRLRLANNLWRFLPGMISISAVVFLWWAASRYKFEFVVRFVNVPSPYEVFDGFSQLVKTKQYWIHIGMSVQRVISGFLLAGALAIPFGIGCAMSPILRRFAVPVVEVFRPIPAIAWVPISIMLWPSNEGSIVFITFLGAFFPIFVNTYQGARSIDETYIRAALCLGARPHTIFFEVMLPAALPSIVTGLTLGMGLCWISVIAAEMISGQYGVGYFTWESYSLIVYPNIIVGMITIGVLGLISSALVRRLGDLTVPWTRS